MRRAFLLVTLVLAIMQVAKAQNGGACPFIVPGVPEARSDCRVAEGIDFEKRRASNIRIKEPEPWFQSSSTITPSDKLLYAKLTAQLFVSNQMPKTIEQVTWEAIVTDPSTNQEMARHTFVSKKRIKPQTDLMIRESAWIPIFLSPGSNAKVMQANQVNRVIEIKYTDGSVRSF